MFRLTLLFCACEHFITCALLALPSLELIDDYTFPAETHFKETTIGGLSALHYDANTATLYALSDDPGEANTKGRERPRFYEFQLDVENKKLKLTPTAVHFFTRQGIPLQPGSIDPEAWVRLSSGNFLISSEGQPAIVKKKKQGESVPPNHPEIFEVTGKGEILKQYRLPGRYEPNDWSEARGLSPRQGIEGLAPAPPSIGEVATLTEGALSQDSKLEPAHLRLGICSRLASMLDCKMEYVYLLDPLEKKLGFVPTVKDSGVSDLLFTQDNEYFSIERSYYTDEKISRNIIKLYRFRVPERATNVAGKDTLSASDVALRKELVFNFDSILAKLKPAPAQVHHVLDNVEGMTFGPKVDGQSTLIFVTDNNFNPRQRTLFYFFKIKHKT
ncbi:MAG: esterase-like activity of phytase family protein [Deltaproteobacteria bacterium]|nr:esterase-like activity of phytase family protein [Deltaproteobacteria bacterium]